MKVKSEIELIGITLNTNIIKLDVIDFTFTCNALIFVECDEVGVSCIVETQHRLLITIHHSAPMPHASNHMAFLNTEVTHACRLLWLRAKANCGVEACSKENSFFKLNEINTAFYFPTARRLIIHHGIKAPTRNICAAVILVTLNNGMHSPASSIVKVR